MGKETSGNWQDLAAYIADQGLTGTEVNVIISGQMASFISTQLSPSQLKYVKKALPFALEDKLSQDPSQVEIHLSQKTRQGQVTAWLTHKGLVSSINKNVKEAGLEIVSVVVDVDLIGQASGVQIWITTDNDMLFYSPDVRYSATKEWLVATAEQFKTPSTISVYVPGNFTEGDILGHQVSSLFEQEVEQHQYQGSLFYQLVKHFIDIKARPTHLYTKRTTTNPVLLTGLMRTVAASLVLAVIFMSSQYMDARTASRKIEAFSESNELLCKQIFGPQKQCRENLLRREVSSLLEQTSPVSTKEITLLRLLNLLGEEINPDMTLESIRYDEGRKEILVSVKGSGITDLEQFKNRLVSRNLMVELSATQQANHSQGNIKIAIGGDQ